jgi:desulfoferrodoxin-like iron-binding protein
MKKSQVFKCSQCQVLVAVLSEGDGQGELSCCGQKMTNVTPDEAKRISKQFGMAVPGTP